MRRRSFLVSTAGGLSVALAGCTSILEASRPAGLEGVDADRQLSVPTLGSGTVAVDVYEDLGCPICHEFRADVFPELESSYVEPDEITYRHRDFPVEAAAESVAMANAARAVQAETRTDDDPAGRFFDYKDRVIDHDDWGDDSLATLAEIVDVEPEAVSEALEADTYYPTLVADWERGENAGVERTPTVVVDGDIVDEPLEVDAIGEAIDDAA
ncbi:DsbA family protein [Natrarchaeobius chitinivorans]|uniref:Disulfide bond formation protein DsbA n=1 Tax=Natrarchaeobius chitinivorans TaxID=1679083 RepID=A0A3N6M5G0_NATCH|nr:thioredoxin domain-containing protein [Natrarchaeobius chitinivorans]RQG97297.1 disulfide bond formation protein DsbA [Natrarchaeobius chitinivorans]